MNAHGKLAVDPERWHFSETARSLPQAEADSESRQQPDGARTRISLGEKQTTVEIRTRDGGKPLTRTRCRYPPPDRPMVISYTIVFVEELVTFSGLDRNPRRLETV